MRPLPKPARKALWHLALVFTLLATAAVAMAAAFIVGVNPWFGIIIPLAIGIAWFRMPRRRPAFLWQGAAALAVLLLWRSSLEPSNDRDWPPRYSQMAKSSIEGDIITIENVRDFAWKSWDEGEERWVTRSYDLATLDGVDVQIEPFPGSKRMAHAQLSFRFGDEFVVISIEARREAGEEFSLLGGALDQMELYYVIATEEDIVHLRGNLTGVPFYTFPVKATPEFVRTLFLDLIASADALNDDPQFYRIVSRNCTSHLIEHADELLGNERKIGLNLTTLFPLKTPALLSRMDFLETSVDEMETWEDFEISDEIREHIGEGSFSVSIRKNLPPTPEN